MKIAILGAGNGGSTVAADLSLRGHEVFLIKTSDSLHDAHFNHLVETGGEITMLEKGKEKHARIAHVTRELSQLAEAEIIIVYIRTDYHEALIQRIIPFLKPSHIVLFNPGYLSTAYMLKHGAPQDLTIIEAESSFIDCRISTPGVVQVGFRNVRNPLSIFPFSNASFAQGKLSALGYSFVYRSSVVQVALHNPNLIVHTVGAIMSIPRIENTKGDYCMYHEVFTPSVWRILEALDKEKMDVMEKLRFSRVSYAEACRFRNSDSLTRDPIAVFKEYAAMPTRAKGPTSVDSRYIEEDVQEGLVLLESLGARLDSPTPVCTALIEMAQAALDKDFRKNGRTLERLGEANIQKIFDQSRKA